MRGYMRTGAGAAINWSVPGDFEDPPPYWRADVSWTSETPWGLTFGTTIAGGEGDAVLSTLYGGWDLFGLLGLFGSSMRDPWPVSPYPIVKPVLGIWCWSESPEDAGLLVGCEVGLFITIPSRGSRRGRGITLEYGWWNLVGADGNDSARFDTFTVDYLFTF
jgi:hypothetical protein